MKKDKIIFWASTVIIVVGVALPAALFGNSAMSIASFKALGFPDYFRNELWIAKALGGLVLLLPMIPKRYKEWAYVGFGIDFVSAFIANFVVFGFLTALEPVAALAALVVSYVYFHKLNDRPAGMM